MPIMDSLSLSLGSGAAVVAIISMVIALGITRSRFKKIKWLLVFTVPFIIANVLYWPPGMFGADSSKYAEYIFWAPVVIIPWCLAGSLASALIVIVINRRQFDDKNKKREK